MKLEKEIKALETKLQDQTRTLNEKQNKLLTLEAQQIQYEKLQHDYLVLQNHNTDLKRQLDSAKQGKSVDSNRDSENTTKLGAELRTLQGKCEEQQTALEEKDKKIAEYQQKIEALKQENKANTPKASGGKYYQADESNTPLLNANVNTKPHADNPFCVICGASCCVLM